MVFVISFAVVLMLTFLLVAFAPRRSSRADAQSVRKLVSGLRGLNLIVGCMLVGAGLVWLFVPRLALAAGLPQPAPADQYASLAAALAAGIGSIGAAYAVGATGSAAIGVIAEKPETFGRVLIFVGLAEGIAIYGLIIAFMILTR